MIKLKRFFGNKNTVTILCVIAGVAVLLVGYNYRVTLNNSINRQILPVIFINLLFGFMSPGIDNYAHLGGLLGGYLASTAVGVKYKSSK